jgi:YVTN family beta-propeller protein
MSRRPLILIHVLVVLASVMMPISRATAAPTAAAGPPRCTESAAPEAGTATPAASFTSLAATPRPSAPVTLQVLLDVPLPGGATRFDYQSLDTAAHRLYIAHMGSDQIVVVDTATERVVGIVDDVARPTGVLVVPELGRVFAAATGSKNVAAIDPERLAVVAHVGRIGFPDGLAYAPQAKRVYVSDESGGGESVIDATSDKVVTTIDIGGEAGNTHYDAGSGCVFVAVQSRDQLVAIDPVTDRLVGRYDLDARCQGPHGFLIEATRRLAFVSCEENATLLVVDLRTMAVTATAPGGDQPDVLAFDPEWRRLYVASEAGVVSIFDEQDHALRQVGEYRAPHAHSIAVDPRTHRVYLPLQDVNGKPVLRILGAART